MSSSIAPFTIRMNTGNPAYSPTARNSEARSVMAAPALIHFSPLNEIHTPSLLSGRMSETIGTSWRCGPAVRIDSRPRGVARAAASSARAVAAADATFASGVYTLRAPIVIGGPVGDTGAMARPGRSVTVLTGNEG